MKILLVDLSNIYWRAFHATAAEARNRAVELSERTIREHSERHDITAICLDSPPYRRCDLYPEYKAERTEKPEWAKEQYEQLVKRLSQKYQIFSSSGYEADDIIATLVIYFDTESFTILSSDKDMWQLIGESVSVVSPATGKTMDLSGMSEIGCTPEQWRLVLALSGGHDNIPGVKGIGVKKGVEIAKKYQNGTNLRVALDNDPDSVPYSRELLACGFDKISLYLALVTLETNAPIDCDRLIEPVEPPQMEDISQEVTVEPEEEEEKTQSIVVGREWSNALEPTTIRDAQSISKWLFESELFEQFRRPQAIFAAIMLGRDIGLPGAVTALNAIHVIKGKPCLKTETMVALVKRSGKADYLKLVESTSERATVKTHRKGDPDPDPTVITFALEDAKKMGLLGRDQWIKQPATMLMWRAFAKIIRIVYPDITMGLYGIEEME